MPKIQWPITDTDQTVTRPVVIGIVEDIKQYTEMPEGMPILFPGPDGKTYQPGSSLNKDDLSNQVRGQMYNQLAIEVDEQYEHDAYLTTPVEHPEHLFVFRDDYLDTYIKPAYSSMDVSINIRFRAQDRTTAERWRAQLKMKIGRGKLVNLHTITYSYFIPPAMLAILQEIHRLRENVAPYGQDWNTYFTSTVSPKATMVTDQAGKNQAWVMAESQMRIQGYWDLDGAVEKGGRGDDGGETWVITAAYKFRYHKPEVCWMRYPLMIHNQLLDQKYRPECGPYEIEKQQRVYQWSTGGYSYFEKGRIAMEFQKRDGIELPTFDEWYPNEVWPWTKRLVSVMLYIDTTNPRLISNLTTDVAPYTIEPEVLAFLKSEAPYMTTPMASLISLTLYQGSTLMDPSSITVDSDLNVMTTFDPDLRQTYHIRLAFYTNLAILTAAAKARLQASCGAAVKIFDYLDPTLKLRDQLPACIIPGNWLPKPGLQQVTDGLNAGTISKGNNQVYGGIKTVMTGILITHRAESK